VRKTILVTDGAGYVGSHATLVPLEAGHDAVALDNLSNSSSMSLGRVAQICARTPHFIEGNVLDGNMVKQVFAQHPIDAVLHFAGLKADGESVQHPLGYCQNNVAATVQLRPAMADAGVHQLVFSSSGTEYGDAVGMPTREDFPTSIPTNPYGHSKLMVEQVLKDRARLDTRWHIALLRYFNPVGAHSSGLIGDDPNGILGNLPSCISQVAIGKRKVLSVFGGNYPAHDGTDE
jgi:UDP-glucose 4-epimerase